MKKIICLVLVLCSIFVFVGCKDDKGDKVADDLITFQNAVENTAPKSADVSTKATSALGVLEGKYNVVYNDDETLKVEYTQEKFNTLNKDEPATEMKTTVNGEVTIAKDGTVTGTIAPSIVGAVKLNLNFAKLEDYTVDKNVLSAKVTADKTEEVLGVAVANDVNIEVTVANEKIASYIITYGTETDSFQIVCAYKY